MIKKVALGGFEGKLSMNVENEAEDEMLIKLKQRIEHIAGLHVISKDTLRKASEELVVRFTVIPSEC